MFTTQRIFNENETNTEYGNRIYKGVIGYHWIVLKDGKIIDTPLFKTFNEVKKKYPTILKIKI